MNRKNIALAAVVWSVLAAAAPIHLQAEIFEDFGSLDRWEPLTFRKIDAHTEYALVTEDGKNALRARAEASASGIIFTERFRVADTPFVEWSWKISNTVEGGNAAEKDGDDYAIRIYIIFPYDSSRVSFLDKVKYETVRRLYGEYPPLSSLNYIWANRPHDDEYLPNPFTDRAMMIPVDTGSVYAGQWRTHTVDIREDYRNAFGEEVPEEASLAVMADTDNTGASATAYLDYIRVKAAR
ncbi:MAG: DUF3047 domain-containing protein [Spirochaetota bacterium]|nr:DUF3047 domain-containing protein [Spirochaetota bacterium]